MDSSRPASNGKRMREEHERLGDPDAAVIGGLARTGRLITGAALILFLAFLSLAMAPATEVKMVGTALGAGILLDATVIRALLVPAVISLLGRSAWWLPGRRGSGGAPRPPVGRAEYGAGPAVEGSHRRG